MTVHEPPTPDYYRELEVDPSASAETIRAAYTALAKRHHPDLNPGRPAAERMQRLNDAYAVLGGEKRRRAYDAVRAAQFAVQPGANPVSLPSSVPADYARVRRGFGRKRGIALGSAVGAASALALVLCAVLATRMLTGGGAKAAPAPTATSSIVRRQTSSGAATSVSLLHAADVVIAAAGYAGFPQIDGLRDAAHGVTGATSAWTFQELGCTVLVGEYDTPDATRAAVGYWRDTAHADEVDSGNVVAGVSNCATPAARTTVLSGLRDILAHPAPTN
jgi:hypothetical protein